MSASYYYRAYGKVVDIDTNEELNVGVDIDNVEIKWNDNSSTLSNSAPTGGAYEDGYMYLSNSQVSGKDLDIYCKATLPDDPLISFAGLKLELYSKNSTGSPSGAYLEGTFTKTTNTTISSWDVFDVVDDIGATGSSYRMPMVFTVYVRRMDKTKYADIMLRMLSYSDSSVISNAASVQITSYDGTETKILPLVAEEWVKCSFDISSGKCYIGTKILELNPGLTFSIWVFRSYSPNFGNLISEVYEYTPDVIAEDGSFNLFPALFNENVTFDNPAKVYLLVGFSGTADPDWEPTPPEPPPVDPDPPTPPPDSKTDYLVYVDSGALGYAPSGHLALA